MKTSIKNVLKDILLSVGIVTVCIIFLIMLINGIAYLFSEEGSKSQGSIVNADADKSNAVSADSVGANEVEREDINIIPTDVGIYNSNAYTLTLDTEFITLPMVRKDWDSQRGKIVGIVCYDDVLKSEISLKDERMLYIINVYDNYENSEEEHLMHTLPSFNLIRQVQMNFSSEDELNKFKRKYKKTIWYSYDKLYRKYRDNIMSVNYKPYFETDKNNEGKYKGVCDWYDTLYYGGCSYLHSNW